MQQIQHVRFLFQSPVKSLSQRRDTRGRKSNHQLDDLLGVNRNLHESEFRPHQVNRLKVKYGYIIRFIFLLMRNYTHLQADHQLSLIFDVAPMHFDNKSQAVLETR